MESTDILRKASVAVYLACEEGVADSISKLLKGAADEIDERRKIEDELRIELNALRASVCVSRHCKW